MFKNLLTKLAVTIAGVALSFVGQALIASQTKAASFTPTAAANLVKNGGFETHVPFVWWANISSGLPGWDLSRDIDLKDNTFWQTAEGNVALDLNGYDKANISQKLSTITGKKYLVRFALAGNPGDIPPLKTLDVYFGNVTKSFSFDITGKTHFAMGWVYRQFTAEATDSVTELTFASTTDRDNNFMPNWAGPALDDISVTPVPEPTSVLTLLALGGLGTASINKRKRQQQA